MGWGPRSAGATPTIPTIGITGTARPGTSSAEDEPISMIRRWGFVKAVGKQAKGRDVGAITPASYRNVEKLDDQRVSR